MARYELRQWKNKEHTEYFVRAASDNIQCLKSMIYRPSVPNSQLYESYIVDTLEA